MDAPRSAPRWRSLAIALLVAAVSSGAFLYATPNAAALTYVRGAISSDTTWGASDTTYVLYGDVTVIPGVTLTILPGTTVRFDPGRTLFVEGTLLANGASGSPIAFVNNASIAIIRPVGIQFNASSTGSVAWSTFDRFDRPVAAMDSSPAINNNDVDIAFFGFALIRSASIVSDSAIARTTVGIFLQESSSQVLRNTITQASTGIQATTSGTPLIMDNVVSGVTGFFAIGIQVTGGANAEVLTNTIVNVQGSRGFDGAAAGSPGTAGGLAIGILVDTASTARVNGNTIDAILGGRGGDGAENPAGPGGRGGNGGVAAAIAVGGVGTSEVDGNIIGNITGGRGGSGGGNATTLVGGDGGNGGLAAGIETLGVTTSARWYWNRVNKVAGGTAGFGGASAGRDGGGGVGGEAYGLFTWSAMDADASGNIFTNITGGRGGNSTAMGTGTADGGRGGPATGVGYTGAAGASVLHMNAFQSVAGGLGGRGAAGGAGANATGAYILGNADGAFNYTTVTGNWFVDIVGGIGGVGTRAGGPGGTGAGAALALVTPFTGWNSYIWIRGGDGGDSFDGTDGGRGGDAAALAVFLTADGWSDGEYVDTILGGNPGAGPPLQSGTAAGIYMEGDVAATARHTIENATLANVGDLDLLANDYVVGTTINTPFDPAKLTVAATSTLTVRNYLAVDVFWPDSATYVANASILVEDEGTPVWNVVAPAGQAAWLLVTDRVYLGSNVANENQTDVTVTYSSYSFQNSPRSVDMSASNTQTFIMIDSDDPISTAGALPPYTTTWNFAVTYTASDGSGVGLGNITLWYRIDGGGWNAFATQPAASSGQFNFTATIDGVYEFETVADDLAGNTEPGPSVNESWTIVDTTRPDSSVQALSTYQTSVTFTVSWAPEPGVTDIVAYTIQYNRAGAGWTDWLIDTTLTSSSFSATPGNGILYEFRSIATDAAGNVEVVSGNDTWTIVDTFAPFSVTLPLAPWQTTLTFLVRWEPEADDVATFQIDVRDDGGPWTTWLPAATVRQASYTGEDGHTYEFRSTATDYAGNVEALPPGNESWTRVDVTPPLSTVLALPTYSASLSFTVTWAPDPSTPDVASYRIEVDDDGSGWFVWIASTTNPSAVYTGLDAHTYSFRSIAMDVAGNVETPGGADAVTQVDVTSPVSSASLSGTVGNAGWYTSDVTVNLSATDAVSGVDFTTYRVDFGLWQTYSGPILVQGDGFHKVEFNSTDVAGNVETMKSASFNVDTTPPTTSASLLGTQGDNGWYVSSVAVSLSAADPASGVDSITYRLEGGAWQPYTAPFSVPSDGNHLVEFYATDVAGLVEATQNVTFRMDTNRPFVVTASPRGSGTNRTPNIIINFNEAMNEASVEQGFSLTPDMNGVFVWSADSTTVTFIPDRELEPSSDYFVVVDSSVRDVAGNTLPQAYTFQFTTEAVPPPSIGAGVLDFWWIIAIIAAVVAGGAFIALRRMAASRGAAAAVAKEPTATIDDVFLLYHDGILIKHETRRLKPDIDTDILSGMLTAVQSFVKDSFRSEEGELDELTFGEMHILIVRGKWLILAAMITGDGTAAMSEQLKACIEDMEQNHADQIEGWDGNMTLAKVLSPYVKKLIRGVYA